MRFLPLFLCLLLFGVAGCRVDDEIKQEQVKYEDREPIHLRVAMVRHGDTMWFFRIDGPEAVVKDHLAAFDAFVKSTTFTDKDDPPVKWTEPAGWKKDPASKDRYASFRLEKKPTELVIKVTKLPAAKFSLMDNMHRWQKQVNVPLSEEAADNLPFITKDGKIGDDEVQWVNLKGLGVHTVSKPPDPLAGQDKDFVLAMAKKGGRVPFKYTAPEGWVKKPAREFVLEVFELADGKAEVTLSTAGGDPTANINRWRDLIGLPPMPKAEVARSVKLMEVADVKTCFYVDLANPDSPKAKNRTLGVIVPVNQTFFFIKMSGPIDIVGRHKDEFETFVKSFKK